MQGKTKSNIFLLLAAIIWGFAFVAQCDATGINLFLLVGVRYILGGLSIIPVIMLFENRNEKKAGVRPPFCRTLLSGMLCGVFLFTASCFQQWGINLEPNAGKAGFITGTYTVLVPVFSFFLFRKKTGLNVVLGALCALVGLYLLSVKNGFSSIALSDIIIFIGAFFWAFQIITIDKFINNTSPLKFSCIQFLTAGVLGLIFTAISGEVTVAVAVAQISEAGIAILYMGICSSGIAYTCQALGQRGADPTYSAIILSTESVFAAIGGALFGIDENMTLRSYIGCVIIFIGIILSQISFKEIFQKAKE